MWRLRQFCESNKIYVHKVHLLIFGSLGDAIGEVIVGVVVDVVGSMLSGVLLLQNVGSVRAVITVHYQAKDVLRIVKIDMLYRVIKKLWLHIICRFTMDRSDQAPLRRVSAPLMAMTFSS
jgi:hypothetical protein